ncbi:uncharacterized protein LOC135460469 [Zonotrichia leucophrys gambelii]|uniref:uncharacterized protein LOC135460469 n=1 Tax=Zonotrichia leucophrys gambelii TaxID=257770 RepID=UPI0031405FF9
MKMAMNLAFLPLLAAVLTLCSSQMGNDPGQNSRQNSGEDSHQNSPQDSFWDVGAFPWISPRGSHRGSGTPRLLPAPVLLRLPPKHKPFRMRCLAPPGFSIGSFELLQEISGIFVQNIVVITNQGWADFPLSRAAVCFRCRYQSHNGSTWLESELSPAIGSSDLGDAECQPASLLPGPHRTILPGSSQCWSLGCCCCWGLWS